MVDYHSAAWNNLFQAALSVQPQSLHREGISPMTKVNIQYLSNIDDLFCKYPGESEPQPVELSLDTRDGSLCCSYDPNIGGGSTFDHQNRLILSTNIPCITDTAANTCMQELAPLAQRVLDGAAEEWDGNN